jgi:hypothetical protein
MFRKRHVHIGPANLTMAPGEAFSFYGRIDTCTGY